LQLKPRRGLPPPLSLRFGCHSIQTDDDWMQTAA
jgi:hypothetical protein